MTPDVLIPLRVTAVLAGFCGLLSLFGAGLLSGSTAAAAALLTAVVTVVASAFRDAGAAGIRKKVGLALLTASLVYVAVGLAGSTSPSRLAATLSPLLIGLLTAQAIGADTRHDVMVSVTVGEFMIVLGVGISPAPW